MCILRLSAIGDVTHVLPLLRSIQHQWPNTKVTWIIGRLEAQLVKDIPGVEFIVFNKSAGWRAYVDLYRQLKGRQFDVLLHMQISLRASLASLLVKAPIRLGYDRPRAKNFQGWFCNHRIVAASPRQHVLDGFLEFGHALGVRQDILQWQIPVSQDAVDYVHSTLGDHRYMVINPCTSVRARNWRNWSIESYAAVSDYVHEHYGLITVLTGGPAQQEKAFAEAIVNRCQHKPVNTVGQTSLKQLLALMDQAQLVIAPDTGPLHMANACGTPVIGLYASSNPQRTGPYSFQAYVANKYPQAVMLEFGKTPEQIAWGKRVRTPDAIELIKVEDVCSMVARVMAEIYGL
ncbi:MAG: lipopolysaccharide heptosyltransferase family protein [Gammaproteobacteria bacterium]|nr:MAG: lipopolysaccharide heptosyltransferase family protein [Gammaproteobacteria bacterium]